MNTVPEDKLTISISVALKHTDGINKTDPRSVLLTYLHANSMIMVLILSLGSE